MKEKSRKMTGSAEARKKEQNMKNYLDMIRAVDPERTALILHNKEYSYGDLVELAVDKQREIPRGGGRKLQIVRESGILGQLVGFLACQGTDRVPLIVPMDAEVPGEFLSRELPEDACMAVMTSGTSGKNKLLLRTFESWHGYFKTQNEIFHIGSESRLFMQGSLAFTGNLNLYMAQLSVGAVIVAEEVFDPRVWKKDIEDHGADGIYLIPAKLRALRQVYERRKYSRSGKNGHAGNDSAGSVPERDTPSEDRIPNEKIRVILSGSQSLGGDEAAGFQKIFPNADLILYYGASELNYITYVHGCDMGKDQTLIGKAFPKVDVRMKDGEIHVTTDYGVMGVEPDAFIGDYGHLDESGNLYFDGRRDDICNINGRKVSAIRVENALLTVPGVAEAAVRGEKTGGHDMLAAWVTLKRQVKSGTAGTLESEKSGDQNEAEEESKRIHTVLTGILPAAEVPKRIMILDEMPKNESGKILKRELRLN